MFSPDQLTNAEHPLISNKLEWKFLRERFTLNHFKYDVDQAKEYLRSNSIQSKYFQLSEKEIHFIKNEVEIDETLRSELNLDFPIIMVHVRPKSLVPIDGYHRLVRLLNDNQTKFQCFVLDFDSSNKIRLL